MPIGSRLMIRFAPSEQNEKPKDDGASHPEKHDDAAVDRRADRQESIRRGLWGVALAGSARHAVC
jgi:hypothetical protein